jgi:hypothetical protein
VHGGHDLSPSLASVIAGVRPHLPLTLSPGWPLKFWGDLRPL